MLELFFCDTNITRLSAVFPVVEEITVFIGNPLMSPGFYLSETFLYDQIQNTYKAKYIPIALICNLT